LTSPPNLLPSGEEEQDSKIVNIQFVLQLIPLSLGEGLEERSSNAKR